MSSPSSSEAAALVALLRQDASGTQSYASRLEAGISARELLERTLTEGDGGQTRLLGSDPGALVAAAERELSAWEQAGIRVVTVLDGDYPPNLLAAHDHPALLFCAGELVEADRDGVAVIGSRRASEAGEERARAVSEHLIAAGHPVVSGLAAGVDTAAHTAVLAAGGRTVAVIGTGLSQAYPPANETLQAEIAARGAVLSQFWPETPPSRATFPLRNAVMSGLTLATVVVEASARSGARIQARRALAHGRPVFLAEELLEHDWANQLAARPAVHRFREPADVTNTLNRMDAGGALVA